MLFYGNIQYLASILPLDLVNIFHNWQFFLKRLFINIKPHQALFKQRQSRIMVSVYFQTKHVDWLRFETLHSSVDKLSKPYNIEQQSGDREWDLPGGTGGTDRDSLADKG